MANSHRVSNAGASVEAGRLAHLALGGIVLSAYSASRLPGVPGGDSGELMAMACGNGIAHPPGYPLLTLLGSWWLRLAPEAAGTPASRLSLLCCVMGAGAAVVLGRAAVRVSGGEWEGLLAAATYAFSPLVWRLSTQYEVFALNNLLCATLLYLTARHHTSGERWAVYAGAFVSGPALPNQHTSLLLVLCLAPAVLWRDCTLIRPRPLLALASLLLLGLLPYLHLPLAGASPPLGSWGQVDSPRGFMRHLLRVEYGSFQLYTTGDAAQDATLAGTHPPGAASSSFSFSPSRAAASAARLSLRWARAWAEETPLVLALLAPLGFILALCSLFSQYLRRGAGGGGCAGVSDTSWLVVLVGSALILYLLAFSLLANLPDKEFFAPILARFWLQPSLLAHLLLAAGARALSSAMSSSAMPRAFSSAMARVWRPSGGQSLLPPRAPGGASGVSLHDPQAHVPPVQQPGDAATDREAKSVDTFRGGGGGGGLGWVGRGLCVVGAGVQLLRGWNMCDQSSNRLMDSFARHHLAALPHGSIALTSGDLQYYPLLYLQLCENVRRDVQVVNTAMMKGEWFLEKQGKTHFRDISFPAPVYMPGVTTCSESLYNIRCLLEENPSPLWTKQRKRKQKGGGGGSRNALGKAGRVMILRRWPPGDLSFEGAFEEWPRGLAREVMPATTGKAPLLRGSALIEWIEESVATLPPIQVYPSFQPLLPPLSPFGNATLPLWDPSSRREQPTVVECLWEMLQGVLWPLEKNVWHARHGGGGGMQARAGAERWGTAPSLDNWEMAAVEEVLAAHTAMSKFVISILRDRHQEFGVASNHTRLSKLSVQLASQVSEALPNEPSSLKNLGALHQHLMNVAPSEHQRLSHMRAMVQAYAGFVSTSRAAHLIDTEAVLDPDVKVLDDWVTEVRGWMRDNKHPD